MGGGRGWGSLYPPPPPPSARQILPAASFSAVDPVADVRAAAFLVADAALRILRCAIR